LDEADRLEFVLRQDRFDLGIAQMHGDDFSEYIAKIGGMQKIAFFMELFLA
jgi:hypothetical protein